MDTQAVLDTNVIVAAHRTKHPSSPNKEIIDRWEAAEFTLLYSLDVLLEYAEKLVEKSVESAKIERLISRVVYLGTSVSIEFFHLHHYPVDPDDIAFVLCALNGDATHIVTYDPHLHDIQQHYAVKICEPLRFLADLRA